MRKNQTIIKANGIEKSFADRKLFTDVNFEIKKGERIGLVGFNGTGKTTLANIIFGKLQPDNGFLEMDNAKLNIGFLTQSIDLEFSQLPASINNELLQYTSQLGLSKVQDWDEEQLGHLSGGEKLKLALSMAWASHPHLLILDEPTNHLDLRGIKWLVAELEKFDGAVLVISHDRHFLDQTIHRVFELENGRMNFYEGNYSTYRREKEQRFANQLHQYEVQQRDIKKVESQIEQLKTWSAKGHRDSTKQGSPSERRQPGFKEYHRVKAKKMDNMIKSKMKRLQNELEKNKVDKPQEEARVRFEFDVIGKRGKRIIEAKDLGVSFHDRTLFDHSHFYINQGERIGLFGENGCGKTTLLKIILDEMQATRGELWRSNSLKIAYLSQDIADLPVDLTVLAALGLHDRDQIFKARTILANLGLTERLISKPIGTLSLGERTRVKLVDMLMKEYDVLILDEPTNHLDLPSREQLEKTLMEYQGTIIIVSHDFYFFNKLCDSLLVFENQRVKRIEEKAEEYLSVEENSQQTDQEERLLIENRIAVILGELSLLDPASSHYQELDREFNELVKKKRKMETQ